MKKKLQLWQLCLLMGASMMLLFSCRQEVFPEKDTEQYIGDFGLRSRVISLDKSKHRQQLTEKIRAVKEVFNPSFGKGVGLQDSITIDTDHIIYMENEDFYDYTFKITRNHSQPNAPLENLVLVPATDGDFHEYIVRYDITEAEKQLLAKGNYQIPKEKIKIRRLQNGAFSGDLFQKSGEWPLI